MVKEDRETSLGHSKSKMLVPSIAHSGNAGLEFINRKLEVVENKDIGVIVQIASYTDRTFLFPHIFYSARAMQENHPATKHAEINFTF